jgi:hypothetical protein
MLLSPCVIFQCVPWPLVDITFLSKVYLLYTFRRLNTPSSVVITYYICTVYHSLQASHYTHLVKFSKTPVLIHCLSLKTLNKNSIKNNFTITVPFSVFLEFSMSPTMVHHELRCNLIYSILFSLSSALCLLWWCSSLVAISFFCSHLMWMHHVILLWLLFPVAMCPVSSEYHTGQQDTYSETLAVNDKP